MKLTDTHVYLVPVETVIAMLQDESATVAKYESMGHQAVQVLEFAADDDAMRIVSSRVVTVDLPGFAKKALKPTNTIVQTDEWRRAADGSWSGSFTGDVQGSPVNISGTMTLKPVASGAEHTVTIDVAVKIPLIGGKIADWAGKNDVRRTLDAEFEFNDARLAAP